MSKFLNTIQVNFINNKQVYNKFMCCTLSYVNLEIVYVKLSNEVK